MVMTRLSSSRLGPSRLVAGVGAIVLVAGLALAGCGKSDEELGIGVTTPVPTGSDTSDGSGGSSDGSGGGPDASDGSTPVASPPARTATRPNVDDYPNMHEDTLQGAEQAFQYYMMTYNYATMSGDTDLLKSMSSPNCEGCANAIESAQRAVSEGNYAVGKETSFSEISSQELDETEVQVLLAVTTSPYQYYDASSKTIATKPQETVTMLGRVEYQEESWMVTVAIADSDGR